MADNTEVIEACKTNSLDRCKVDLLKDYLRSVGQHVSGNKSELIERVKGAHNMGLSNVFTTQTTDRAETANRGKQRLQTPVGETMVHPSCIDRWSDNVESIPDLNEKDIYNYFVYKLNTKRQLKSKVMYEDGHVHSVQVNDSDENQSHSFIRCKAIPSMPSANKNQRPDYNVWVMLSKMTGCINSAECSCTAGEGEGCNHIAALLYAIADITDKKKDGKLAPTAMKCKWNNPRKRKLTPKKSQDLTFQKVVHGKEYVRKKLLVPVYDVKKSVDIDKFRDKLLSLNSNAGWLKNFEIKTDDILIPRLHSQIIFNFCDSVNIKDRSNQEFFLSYFEQISITRNQCMTIECLTRSQCQSDLWVLARQDRLTASNFGRICKLKNSTKPDSTLKDLLNYRTFDSVHTKYGRDHESVARRKYEKTMRISHPGLTVKKCGLLVTPEYPHLGASPDGFVNCTHCEDHLGLLEVKCPSSHKFRSKIPEECAIDPKFFCCLIDGKVTLKRNHSYFYQVQGQLGISGRKWCDFVVWTCLGISVERIFADNEFFQHNMLPSLKDFYVRALIPELFTRRVERGFPLYKQDVEM